MKIAKLAKDIFRWVDKYFVFRKILKFLVVFGLPFVFFLHIYENNIQHVPIPFFTSGDLTPELVHSQKFITNELSPKLFEEFEKAKERGELPVNPPPKSYFLEDLVFWYSLPFIDENTELHSICLKNQNEYYFQGKRVRNLKSHVPESADIPPERLNEAGAMSLNLYLPDRPVKEFYAKHKSRFTDCKRINITEISSGFFALPAYATFTATSEDGVLKFPDHVDASNSTIVARLAHVPALIILGSIYGFWWGFILLAVRAFQYCWSKSWFL